MSYLTLIAFSAIVIFAVLSAGSGKVLNAASDRINDHVVQVQDRVSIALYFETFSFPCFEHHYDLRLAADQVGLENLDMYYHPFGNATISQKEGKMIIECQHGQQECYFNEIIACSIDFLKDPDTYIRYNECVLADLNIYHDANIDDCAKKFNVDDKSIKECATSDRGFQLLKYHGEETLKLNLDGVPKLYINGKVYNYAKYDDLVQHICAQFSVKPKACKKPSEGAINYFGHSTIKAMKFRSEP